MSNDRRQFTRSQKLTVLREHLIEKVPISEVCQKHGIQSTLFYPATRQRLDTRAAGSIICVKIAG